MAILWTEDNTLDSDWIKTVSWDLPRDPEGFLASLGKRSLESFMALPAAQAMPESLREALGELGYSTVLKYAVGQPRNARGQFASTDGGGGGNDNKITPANAENSLTAAIADAPRDVDAETAIYKKYGDQIESIYDQINPETGKRYLAYGFLPENLKTQVDDLEDARKAEMNALPYWQARNAWESGRFSLQYKYESFATPEEARKARAKWVLDDKKTLQRQRALRAGKPPSEEDLLIDNLVNSSKVLRDTEVFRGAVLKPTIANKLVAGFSFTDKGFMAQDFVGGREAKMYLDSRTAKIGKEGDVPVMMRGVLRAGTTGVDVGVGEMVLPRNTTVNVLSRETQPDGTILVNVEYDTP